MHSESATDSPAATSKRRRSFSVCVDDDVCDGCGVCIFFCKPLVLAQGKKVNRRGAWPVTVVDATRCTGCMLCEYGCPQLAISAREVRHDR
jgi:2-oxoglutarate ferredoxin oxidoreductase subunit delta